MMDAITLALTLECLTAAVYHEARGENQDGQLAVLEVIMNRVHDERFPDTPCEVIKAPAAFSFITYDPQTGEPTWPEPKNTELWDHLHWISTLYFANGVREPAAYYGGPQLTELKHCYPTNYLNKEATSEWRRENGLAGALPKWATLMTQTAVVGKHTFFTADKGCEEEIQHWTARYAPQH